MKTFWQGGRQEKEDHWQYNLKTASYLHISVAHLNQTSKSNLNVRSIPLLHGTAQHRTAQISYTSCNPWLKCKQKYHPQNTTPLSGTNLPVVELRHIIPLHEEHVDEVDEDAGSLTRVHRREGQPLVEDHEDQVAEEAQQEEQLRKEDQVQIELFLEVP